VEIVMDQSHPATASDSDLFVIRDPGVDVDALMKTVRENVARRRAEGAYREDLDAIADAVFAEVVVAPEMPPAAEGASLDAVMAEINVRWMVREVPFTSHAPLVGPLIVAVRSFWNWMSTKWYVRAILGQQVGFNGLVARAFGESHAAHQALTNEVRRLEALGQRQQEQITLLAEEIERLRQQRASGQ
jgi:hypothetical protein